MARIGIIGGGLAGVTAGRLLLRAGHSVHIFEKARGLGGRMATRRFPDGGTADHGAQYFKAQDPDFAAYANACPEIKAWASSGHSDWLVGAPAMNSVVKQAGQGLTLHLSCRIVAITRAGQSWVLHPESGQAMLVDALICTAPAPQSAALLDDPEPDLKAQCDTVSMIPNWTVMLAFEKALPTDRSHLRIDDPTLDPVLGWAARNSSKPGRHTQGGDKEHPDSWTLQASPGFSQTRLESEKDPVISALMQAFERHLGLTLPDPALVQAHRWRYAIAKTPLGRDFCANQDGTLYLAGDWVRGTRVEDAFLSGRAAALDLIARYSD